MKSDRFPVKRFLILIRQHCKNKEKLAKVIAYTKSFVSPCYVKNHIQFKLILFFWGGGANIVVQQIDLCIFLVAIFPIV